MKIKYLFLPVLFLINTPSQVYSYNINPDYENINQDAESYYSVEYNHDSNISYVTTRYSNTLDSPKFNFDISPEQKDLDKDDLIINFHVESVNRMSKYSINTDFWSPLNNIDEYVENFSVERQISLASTSLFSNFSEKKVIYQHPFFSLVDEGKGAYSINYIFNEDIIRDVNTYFPDEYEFVPSDLSSDAYAVVGSYFSLVTYVDIIEDFDSNDDTNGNEATVPLPSSAFLLGLGSLGLCWSRRRVI